MEKHFELSDNAFEKSFASNQFNAALFTHEAHLRLAWIHITKYGIAKAITNVSSQILHFVRALGEEDKFNLTLTVAALKAVHHFINKSEATTFAAFITEFPQLKYNFKELLECHYSIDIFRTEEVKKVYITPDLLPFDE